MSVPFKRLVYHPEYPDSRTTQDFGALSQNHTHKCGGHCPPAAAEGRAGHWGSAQNCLPLARGFHPHRLPANSRILALPQWPARPSPAVCRSSAPTSSGHPFAAGRRLVVLRLLKPSLHRTVGTCRSLLKKLQAPHVTRLFPVLRTRKQLTRVT